MVLASVEPLVSVPLEAMGDIMTKEAMEDTLVTIVLEAMDWVTVYLLVALVEAMADPLEAWVEAIVA